MGARRPNWLLVLVFLCVAGAAAASMAIRLTFQQLTDGADRVVVAHLSADPVSAWGPDQRRIYTTFTFEVEEEVAGAGPRTFTLVQPGGEVGRIGQRTWGYPSFDRGERVLLFLRQVTSGYRVVGMSQGVFGFEKTADDKEFIVQRLEGLSFPGDKGLALRLDKAAAIRELRERFEIRVKP